MEHHFNTDIAKIVGVNAAVIYYNIEFWVRKNMAAEEHFHDGKYWTFNSRKGWAQLFPYLTEKQIRTAIDKMVEAGLILKGNYNKEAFDHTTWYTIADEISIENSEQNEEKRLALFECHAGPTGPTNTIYKQEDNKRININISPNAHAHTYTREELLKNFADEVANDTAKMERICMTYHITTEDYRDLAAKVLLDWEFNNDLQDENINWRYFIGSIRHLQLQDQRNLHANAKRDKLKAKPIDERLAQFRAGVKPLVAKYGRELCNAFDLYWTELSDDGLMRFEYCTAWDTETRLIQFRDKK